MNGGFSYLPILNPPGKKTREVAQSAKSPSEHAVARDQYLVAGCQVLQRLLL